MRSHGRTTVLLFVFFQALYALTSSGNAFRVPDEFEVYFQAEHLIDEGDLSVPQTLTIRAGNGDSIFFGRTGLDRKPYAPYGPLTALLALPHHLIGRAVAASAGVPRAPLPAGIVWVLLVGGITMTAFTARRWRSTRRRGRPSCSRCCSAAPPSSGPTAPASIPRRGRPPRSSRPPRCCSRHGGNRRAPAGR